MKRLPTILLAVISGLFATAAAVVLAQVSAKTFVIYDNMAYKEKPDTVQAGLVSSNVIYENKIWPNRRDIGALPDRETFQALVRANSSNPGPLVIDIENLSLRFMPEAARHNAQTLATLADWAHQAAPGKIIGYYGTNTFSDVPAGNLDTARELAKHVDAFFPALYTFDNDRARWEKRAETSLAQSRELDPNKPVYFYIWPQYHVGSVRALRYVDADYWKFQLETARRYGDGVVIWGSNTYVWNPASGWWDATVQFATTLKAQKPAAQPK